MTLPPFTFLRLKQVLQIIPISKAGWYRGAAAGIYPKALKIGRTSVYRSDVIAALAERIATQGNAEGAQ